MRLLLALTVVALLAGCLSPAEPQGEAEPEAEEPLNQPRAMPGQEPDETPGNEPPAEGEGVERMHSCSVESGAPSTTLAINDIYIGGCPLTTTTSVSVVVARSPGPGCTINVGLEQVVSKGTSISAKCDEPGAADNSITLRTWS